MKTQRDSASHRTGGRCKRRDAPQRPLGGFGAADVELLDRDTAYDGFFRLDRFRLRHASHASDNPVEIVRELLLRPAAAAILPYDPERDRVIMIEQFRIGAYMADESAPWLLETVAGTLEPGETAHGAVRREAKEEAGLEILDLVPVHSYFPSPGGCSEQLHLFVGRVASEEAGGVHGIAAEGEDIRVHIFSIADACRLLATGHIRDAQSIIALQWLILNHETLRRRWEDPPRARRRKR